MLDDFDDTSERLDVLFCDTPDMVGEVERHLRLNPGRRYLPISVVHSRVDVGPVFAQDATSLHDYITRQESISRLDVGPPASDFLRPASGQELVGHWEARLIAAVAFRHIEQFEREPQAVAGRLHSIDLVSLEITPHVVLPLPIGPSSRYSGRHRWEDLIDPRFGVIEDLSPERVVPRTDLVHRTARLADLSKFDLNWVDDRQGHAASIDPVTPIGRMAVSEALEAYGGACWDRAAPAFDPSRPRAALALQEVAAEDLLTGAPTTAPAGAVFLNWARICGYPVDETTYTNLAGIAAGPSTAFATISAIEEVVERDAMTTWWINGPTLPRRAASPELCARLGLDKGQSLSFIDLPNALDLPVVVAVLRGAARFPLLGFATRATHVAAEEKAAIEAVLLEGTVEELDNPHSPMWRAFDSGALPRGSVKPWRNDSHYIESYGGPEGVLDLIAQLQYNLDPVAEATYAHVLTGPPTLDRANRPLEHRHLGHYLERIRQRGLRATRVVLTPWDLEMCGVSVVRVLLDGLISNAPAAFAPTDHPRIAQVARQQSWHLQGGRGYNRAPMPYA